MTQSQSASACAHSLAIVIDHSPVIMLSELEVHDLFARYRSPYKA